MTAPAAARDASAGTDTQEAIAATRAHLPAHAPQALEAARAHVPARAQVLEALAEVRDPELDEPITDLGFVVACRVEAGGEAEVVLRLPTPQCAPSFAYLMAADARRAVLRVAGVRAARVRLSDHFTGQEITRAVARGDGFATAFPGEADDESLRELRELFLRKALVARQSRLCEALLARGASAEQVAGRRVEELPHGSTDVRRCLQIREQLGITCDPDSPAFVRPDGQPIASDGLERWLRASRMVRVSLELNGGICRSLLRAREGVSIDDPEEVPI